MDFPNKKVLFICSGNICRSPMVERLFLHAVAVEEAPLNEFKAASAGVAAMSGEAASVNSVKALAKVSLDLNDHKSQPVTQELIDQSDVIFGMTHSHLNILKNHFSIPEEKLYLVRDFMKGDGEVPDPFGQSLQSYERCRDSLVEAIPSIIKFIKEQWEK